MPYIEYKEPTQEELFGLMTDEVIKNQKYLTTLITANFLLTKPNLNRQDIQEVINKLGETLEAQVFFTAIDRKKDAKLEYFLFKILQYETHKCLDDYALSDPKNIEKLTFLESNEESRICAPVTYRGDKVGWIGAIRKLKDGVTKEFTRFDGNYLVAVGEAIGTAFRDIDKDPKRIILIEIDNP